MEQARKLRIWSAGGLAAVGVKVVPSASRDRLAGALGECLKVTCAAPAEKGRANAAAARLLARAAGVAPRDVLLLSGAAKARKTFGVRGLSPAALRRRLAEA
jgi:hypothetical protein